jgi:hypothetical protein
MSNVVQRGRRIGYIGGPSPAIHGLSSVDANGDEWDGAYSGMDNLVFDTFDEDTGIATFVEYPIYTPPFPDPPPDFSITTFTAAGTSFNIPIPGGMEVGRSYLFALVAFPTNSAATISGWSNFEPRTVVGVDGTMRISLMSHNIDATDITNGYVSFDAGAQSVVMVGATFFWASTSGISSTYNSGPTTTALSVVTSPGLTYGGTAPFKTVRFYALQGATDFTLDGTPDESQEAGGSGGLARLAIATYTETSPTPGHTATATEVHAPVWGFTFLMAQQYPSWSPEYLDGQRSAVIVGRQGDEMTWVSSSRIDVGREDTGNYVGGDILCMNDQHVVIAHGIVTSESPYELSPCVSLIKKTSPTTLSLVDGPIELDSANLYGFGGYDDDGNMALCKLTSTKFLVSWIYSWDDADEDKVGRPAVRVGTISGDTISLGPTLIIADPEQQPMWQWNVGTEPSGGYPGWGGGGAIRIEALSETLALICFKDTVYPEWFIGDFIAAISVSGTTVTAGDPLCIGRDTNHDQDCGGIAKLSSSRAAIMTFDYEAFYYWNTSGEDGNTPVLYVIDVNSSTLQCSVAKPVLVVDPADGFCYSLNIEAMRNKGMFLTWMKDGPVNGTNPYIHASQTLMLASTAFFNGSSTGCGWSICGGIGYDDLWINGGFPNAHERSFRSQAWKNTSLMLFGYDGSNFALMVRPEMLSAAQWASWYTSFNVPSVGDNEEVDWYSPVVDNPDANGYQSNGLPALFVVTPGCSDELAGKWWVETTAIG